MASVCCLCLFSGASWVCRHLLFWADVNLQSTAVSPLTGRSPRPEASQALGCTWRFTRSMLAWPSLSIGHSPAPPRPPAPALLPHHCELEAVWSWNGPLTAVDCKRLVSDSTLFSRNLG